MRALGQRRIDQELKYRYRFFKTGRSRIEIWLLLVPLDPNGITRMIFIEKEREVDHVRIQFSWFQLFFPTLRRRHKSRRMSFVS
jgi:hypothetical protein